MAKTEPHRRDRQNCRELFHPPNNLHRMKNGAAILSVILILLTCGCVSSPAPADAKVSAYSVGDRGRVMFDEIVVSLPFRANDGTVVSTYQNLHVAPAAVVNVRRTTLSSAYEAESILERLQVRVAARLSEVLSKLPPQSLNDTAAIRAIVLKESQAVVNEGMTQWEHAQDYQIEMVIASLYWTDPSVGRASSPRGRWF